MKTDIIIIGAGPGGYETALAAAKRGKNVTLFNGENLGGTCLFILYTSDAADA